MSLRPGLTAGPPTGPPTGLRTGLRIGLALAGLALLTALFASGAVDILADADRVAAYLRSIGIWGYVLYVASFALLEPFGVPGILFVVPAAMVWPSWLACLLSLVGATGAGIIGGAFARFIARDWVEAHMPARFRAFDDRLARRGLRTVIVVRLLFFLAAPAHWVLGLSTVPFRTLILGTAIGFIPGIVALTLVGGSLLDATRDAPPWLWLALGIAIAAAVAFRRMRRSRASDSSLQSGPGLDPLDAANEAPPAGDDSPIPPRSHAS
jgi:uncharacterized membrane protein YdjX (TVP38/TMEM64 family)